MPKIKKLDKVYSKNSNIPNSGKGLFAKKYIKKGETIVEYTGSLKKLSAKTNSNRSLIYFEDGFILECPNDDLASFANDAINFNRQRRKLMAALKSNKPFYRIHTNARVNAELKTNVISHRAFLIAYENIEVGEEIFCHYGFDYWFRTEIQFIGFLEEDEIETNGFPEKIFEYPAFNSYVKEFYPKTTHVEISEIPDKDKFMVTIYQNDDTHIPLTLKNYAKCISRIAAKEYDEMNAVR